MGVWKFFRKGKPEKPLVEVEPPAARTMLQEVVPKKYSLEQILKETEIDIKELINSHTGLKKGKKEAFLKKANKLTQEELTELVLTHPEVLNEGKIRNGALKIIDKIFEKSETREDVYRLLADLVVKGKCNERLITDILAIKVLEAKKQLTDKIDSPDIKRSIDKMLQEGKTVDNVIEELKKMTDQHTKVNLEGIKSALKQLNRERYENILNGLSQRDKEFADYIKKLVDAMEIEWSGKQSDLHRKEVDLAFKDVESFPKPAAREAIEILEKNKGEIELAYKMGVPQNELSKYINAMQAGGAKAEGVLAKIDNALLALWKIPFKVVARTPSGAKKYPGMALTFSALLVLGYLTYSDYIKSKSEEEKRKIEDLRLSLNLRQQSIIPINGLSDKNMEFLNQHPRVWGWLNSILAGGTHNAADLREYIENDPILMGALDTTVTSIRGIVSNHPTLKNIINDSVMVEIDKPKNEQTPLRNAPILYKVSPDATNQQNEQQKEIRSLAELLKKRLEIAKWMKEWGIRAEVKEIETVKEQLEGKNLNALSPNDIQPLMSYIKPDEMKVYKDATDEEKKKFDNATKDMKAQQLVAMQLAGMSVEEWLRMFAEKKVKGVKVNKLIENLKGLTEGLTEDERKLINNFIKKINEQMRRGIPARRRPKSNKPTEQRTVKPAGKEKEVPAEPTGQKVGVQEDRGGV